MRFRLLGLALLASLLAGQAPSPRVSYSRSFKGSQPAFFQVEVSQDGQGLYQAREADADPTVTLHFTASPAIVVQVFAAAATLRQFTQPRLQSKDKVAYTGDRMLAFDDAAHHASQDFTYTTVPAAAALAALFEKISVAGTDAILLQRAADYDRLNVLEVVENIEQDWNGHGMAEPQLLEPVLQAVADNPALMEAARRRARALAVEMAASNK